MPQSRLGQDNSAVPSALILLDTSGSMSEPVGSRRRIDVLADILRQVLPATPGARLIAFSSIPHEIESGAPLPEPGGGTDLAAALNYAGRFHPNRVVVISDGEPTDADAALAAARALGCPIGTYYAGDEKNHAATSFLRMLAWSSPDGLGDTRVADLADPKKLAADLRLLLLTGPAR
jgi:hypothetical protein